MFNFFLNKNINPNKQTGQELRILCPKLLYFNLKKQENLKKKKNAYNSS